MSGIINSWYIFFPRFQYSLFLGCMRFLSSKNTPTSTTNYDTCHFGIYVLDKKNKYGIPTDINPLDSFLAQISLSLSLIPFSLFTQLLSLSIFFCCCCFCFFVSVFSDLRFAFLVESFSFPLDP